MHYGFFTARRFVALLLTMSALLGCGTSNVDQVGRPLTLESFNSSVADFAQGQIGASAIPVLMSPPTGGSAQFAGQIAFDFGGTETGSALGALLLTTDFTSRDIGGAISDVVVATSSGAVSSLSGQLSVIGSQSGAAYSASASGTLSGSVGTIPVTDLTTNLLLDGALRGFGITPSALAGTTSGNLTAAGAALNITSGLHHATVRP